MTVPASRPDAAGGLSCYTANLAAYLRSELPDADRWLAQSVRLAVRADLPGGDLAFSHHSYPLDQLPDGTRLRYVSAGQPAEAVAGLRAELDRHGRVLAVTDSARLPWSPAARSGPPAPHWLLIVAADGERWQVRDAFAGLLPAGEQQPYAGWLDTAALLAAMTPPPCWAPEQQQRNALAFGFPVPVPANPGPQWLRRVPDDGLAAELPGRWLTEAGDVLPFLAGHLADRYLDDLWSAAAHQAFRYRWLAGQPDAPGARREQLAAAGQAWARLPAALRFALDSARRGRPRTSLVAMTFRNLVEIESSAG